MSARGIHIALVVLALLWFGTLGVRPLYKADESRYAELSREMAVSGDWVTPRLNDFKYFEKPPLQYWATTIFFRIFDVNDAMARLWAALTGFAGIVLVLLAGNRLFGAPAGFLAAAVLAGSPLYVLLGQYNTLDMGVSFFLGAAMAALAGGYALAFWAACALAVLSKGLIGIVLPGATVFLYMILRRDWNLLKRLKIVKGGLLFLVITAPWFIAVSIANPEFAHFFFIQEHFQRFTSEMHHREGAWWYFLPILAAGLLPWLLPAMGAWWRGLRERKEGFNPELLLALWALVVLLFFSASHSKLPSYILPMFPALALLTGKYLAAARNRLLALQAVLVALGGLGAALIVPHFAGAAYRTFVPWLVVAAACLGASGCIGYLFARRGKVATAAAALALGGLAATLLGGIGHGTLAPRFSAAGLIASIEQKPPASAPVFAVDIYDHTLPWYLRRTVTMVGYRDELGQAVDWEPGKFIADRDAFARAWKAAPVAYAFVAEGEFAKLRATLPMRAIARDSRYVFVGKP